MSRLSFRSFFSAACSDGRLSHGNEERAALDRPRFGHTHGRIAALSGPAIVCFGFAND